MERIKADAKEWANDIDRPSFQNHHRECGYIAGATAEAANTQRAIDLMQEIINLSDRNQVAWNQAKDFIQQWKSGKKEVENGIH